MHTQSGSTALDMPFGVDRVLYLPAGTTIEPSYAVGFIHPTFTTQSATHQNGFKFVVEYIRP
jgi:hypothetical protein